MISPKSAITGIDTSDQKVLNQISVPERDGRILFIPCEVENMVYVIDVKNFEIINKIRTGDDAYAMICLNKNETEIK
jgi:hypothetical protein